MLDVPVAVLREEGLFPFDQQASDAAFLRRGPHAAPLHPAAVWRNPAPAELYEHALLLEAGTSLASNGALVSGSGGRTGRSPGDKRLVRDAAFQGEVWWGPGSPNLPIDTRTFLANRQTAIDFINLQQRVYVVEGLTGWEPSCQLKVRVICSSARHALVAGNMLVRPSPQQLAAFGEPDFVVYHCGDCPANKYESYMSSSTSICTSLAHREVVILGTCYAGEMKKGIWTLMHYHLPVPDVLFLHSGCNVGPRGDVTLFMGLSGTGKTALSNDAARQLVGDDEHCWGPSGVFNIEGGCLAKVIGLTPDSPPGLHDAIGFGTLLENVVVDPRTGQVDFNDASITENIRASFPMANVPHARIPCVAPHPTNVILLTCDAFGVLPPVSKLTLPQALYHFVSGYTAKIAGTEHGTDAPHATFSPCFAGAFLLWHPLKYAALLATKLQQHGTQAWLVNTGWTGGPYGVGRRVQLQHTRAMVAAIHSGALLAAPHATTPVFGLRVPTCCPGVPSALLDPGAQWQGPEAFDAALARLGSMFARNMRALLHGAAADAANNAGSGWAAGCPNLLQLLAEGGPMLAHSAEAAGTAPPAATPPAGAPSAAAAAAGRHGSAALSPASDLHLVSNGSGDCLDAAVHIEVDGSSGSLHGCCACSSPTACGAGDEAWHSSSSLRARGRSDQSSRLGACGPSSQGGGSGQT